MKRIFLSGLTALLAIGAAQAADLSVRPAPLSVPSPAPAAIIFSGDLALYGGIGPETWNGTNYTNDVYGGYGRLSFLLSPTVSVQLDVNAEHYHLTTTDYWNWNVAGHASLRNASYLLGVFGSVGRNGYYEDTEGTIGVEGMLFLGTIHLYGQIGFTSTIADVSGYPNNTPYGHGEIRYFVTPDLMLAANAGVAHVSEPGYSATVTRWGADIEAKLGMSSLGGFLSYQGSHENWNDATEHTVHNFLVGLKLYFNSRSLQSASQSGATLRDLNPWTGFNGVRQIY